MEAEICEVCHKEIPTQSMTMHRVHCERNTVKCPKCKELISKLAQEEHDRLYHQLKECPHCNAQTEARYFEQHECPKAPKICPYCEATYPLDLFQPHTEACGSRSEQCEKCKKFILLKNFKSHQDSCGKEKNEIKIEQKQYQDLQRPIIREPEEIKFVEPIKINHKEAKAKRDAEDYEKELKARQYRDLQNQIEAERRKKSQLETDRFYAEPERPENWLPNLKPKNKFDIYELPPPIKQEKPPMYQSIYQQIPRNIEPINQPQWAPRFPEPINQPQWTPRFSEPIFQANTSEDERIARELAEQLDREAKENIDRMLAEGLLREEQGYGAIIDDNDILEKELLAKEDERMAKELLAKEDEKLAKELLAKEDERLARQLAGNTNIPADRRQHVLDYSNFGNEQDYSYFQNLNWNFNRTRQQNNVQNTDLTEEEQLKIAVLESLNHK